MASNKIIVRQADCCTSCIFDILHQISNTAAQKNWDGFMMMGWRLMNMLGILIEFLIRPRRTVSGFACHITKSKVHFISYKAGIRRTFSRRHHPGKQHLIPGLIKEEKCSLHFIQSSGMHMVPTSVRIKILS